MDRESHNDTAVIHSSIALLQERFKQLQRVKAMRAEREVLRVLPLSAPNHFTTKSMDPSMHYKESASLFLHPQPDQFVFAHGHGFGSPLSQVSLSLSLWPTLQTKYEEEDYIHTGTETQLLINLWPTVTSSPSSNSTSSNKFEDWDTDCDSDDVDTSLHL
ncbi:hypothetical protein RchiOBHm_Chr5g0000811 [Rosa chinensis]|uniref:Uncharacterized protein n=1 Tax=Rosa chinensis TaxID=74649 RepID=A0A2P6Q208_ROSCH|nr:hypothetical protein RchiOBHm_Chr5g0000811 [Rosa chinensis]